MTGWLRQSTSVDLAVGPFVDSTDGNTAEGSLTITQPDVRLKKNNGNWAQKAAAQTLTHEEFGNYEVTLDATDTNTLGRLRLHIHESGALPIWDEWMVVPANIYDSVVLGSDLIDVNAAQWLGTAAATPITPGIPRVDTKQLIGRFTVSAAGSGTFTLNGTPVGPTENTALEKTLVVVESATTGAGQSEIGVSYDGTTQVLTLQAPLPTTPTGTIVIALYAYGVDPASPADLAAAIATYFDAAAPGSTLLNLINANVGTTNTTVTSIDSKVGVPTDLGGGATIAFNLSDIEAQTDDIGVSAPTANQVRDAVWAQAMTELAAIPGATGTVLQALTLLFQAVRNQTVTSTPGGTTTIGNNANGVIGTAPISDAAGVFTKGKFV